MSRRPSTIGANPLDAVVPLRQAEPQQDPPPAKSERRERVTVSLPAELVERARNAVFWTPGATLAALVEVGIEAEVKRREEENRGAFKARGQALKPGRRFKDEPSY
jgi:post-segregation antitoxin (ccd killing protein)